MYTEADTEAIYWGEHPDFDADYVHEDTIDKTRWATIRERVYCHKASGEHYAVTMSIADEASSDDNEPDGPPVKVVAREVVVTKWVKA